MTSSITTDGAVAPGRRLRIGVLLARMFVGIVFIAAGAATLFAPLDYLAANIPWTTQFGAAAVRAIGAVDLVGGLGLLLPLARSRPDLTRAAALGCAALQVCSIVLHLWRAEPQFLPLNALLLVLSLFIVHGLRKLRS